MARYFLDEQGKPLAVGATLRNPELAQTFEQIAAQGPEVFYSGEIAAAIVAKVRSHANAGYLSLQDMQQYQAKAREPLCGPYKAWRICGMPPPSSGGVAVLQTLGILEALQQASPQRDLAVMRPLRTSSVAGLEAPPPMPLDCGSTRVSTICMAMAASMALPPARSIARPASLASGLAAAAMCRLACTDCRPLR